MQNLFGPLDSFKLNALIQDAITKLQFLAMINKEDDASSELAGYEINKLLHEQNRLENKYEELLNVRGQLKGISNKRKLDQVQKEIHEVAALLKESTKNLCRLFRENPDLVSDAMKIEQERKGLVMQLQRLLIANAEANFVNYQQEVIKDMEDQSKLRNLITEEKELNNRNKELTLEYRKEKEEYEIELNEKQAQIQKLKEKLVRKKAKGNIEKEYAEKNAKAEEGTDQRLYKQKLDDMENMINEYETKKKTEIEVFEKVKEFLTRKREEANSAANAWAQKAETKKNESEDELRKLMDQKNDAEMKLNNLKKFVDEAHEQKKKEESDLLEKEREKRRKQEEQERLDNAIRTIQDYYQLWKSLGAPGSKKKKGRKKAAAKKK